MESNGNRFVTVSSDVEQPQPYHMHGGAVAGPVAILWDIENCPVPNDVRPEDVGGNIRMALQMQPATNGSITLFSAYGDFNAFPRRLREGCQRTGVKLVDVPNGRKDAADKAILVDLFLFALDNKPPSCIVLISGDIDFAPALHVLGQRGYIIVLVIPSGVGVSSALLNAGHFVLDWPYVARGSGFLQRRPYVGYSHDFSSCRTIGGSGFNAELLNDEDVVVNKGLSQSDYFNRINQMRGHSSLVISGEPGRASCPIADEQFLTSSASHTSPPGFNEGPLADQITLEEQWIRPGDLEGLKSQMVKLLETSGGSLPLVRVPALYWKTYGRPLYVAEYGVCKLVNLVRKLGDTFFVVGKGQKKSLCLRNFAVDSTVQKYVGTPVILKRKPSASAAENGIEMGPQVGSSSDDYSEDERISSPTLGVLAESNDQLKSFKQELQELLVCYSCPVPLYAFASLYEQRYKKALDYQTLAVEGLDELVERLKDVVVLHEDETTSEKYLMSNYTSY